MTKQTVSVGANPAIEIERVGGDLVIDGWERADLEVQGDGFQIERDGNSICISGAVDLHASAPRGANLIVGFVGGDVQLENLDGKLELAFVGGDAVLRNLTGQVSLNGWVNGNTQLENVSKVSVDARKVVADAPERTRQKIDQATRRVEQKLRHAEMKIQNAARKAQHRAHVRVNAEVGRWKWNATPGSFVPGEAEPHISDEERMTILKMLQERKITAEQAEKLLAALEVGAE